MEDRTAVSRVKVAVVDDDADTRLWFRDILQSSSKFAFAGDFANAAEALAGLPRLRPDLTLMDIRLPDLSGLECARQLRQRMPSLKIVIVTGTHEARSAADSRLAGAVGYLAKPVASDQLLGTLTFICAQIAGAGEPPHPTFTAGAIRRLTPREQQIMQCFADGLYYKEIPEKLGISGTAFRKCQHKIFMRLKVSSRSEAVSVWLKNGGCA